MMLPHLAGGYGYHPEGRKSFGQAFSKACRVQRQGLWSLPAGSEIPQDDYYNGMALCF